ncbi:craniofacial development protein 2-like [Palaemon carinicauda]|uniref:craniofacial development protein 2-like n=1 Tax=Palaemon carinicauda TaxID=392227 RepID=UPI0035B5925E
MDQIGKLQQVESEFMKYSLEILDIGETCFKGIDKSVSNIVMVEVVHYKYRILQEVRWTEYGECTIDKQCILYSGRQDGRYEQGVGFFLTEKVRKSLVNFHPINERLETIRINCKWFRVIVIGSYAPTEDSEYQDKDLFYEKLQEVLDDIPKHDMIVLAGEFNAKVGRETDAYAPAIGRESLHEHSNDNGTRLVSFAITNNLIIGGTLFPHKDIHKHTWTLPDSIPSTKLTMFFSAENTAGRYKTSEVYEEQTVTLIII